MFNKKRAEKLEKALVAGEKSAECNDSELSSLLEMNELLTKHVYDAKEPSPDFQDRLRESIASKRADHSKRMKLPKMSFPRLQITVPQLRYSAAVAFVVLVSVVVGTTGLLPFGNNQFGNNSLGNFSRLIIDEAYAQDNFTVAPTSADTTGIDSATGFTITSQIDISLKDLQDNIAITPQTEFNLTKVDDRTFFLEPLVELQGGQVYTVTVDASYLNATGQLRSRDYSWAFQVKDPFKILHTIPADRSSGVPVDTGIEFTFSYQNVEGLQDAFSITPHIDGRFETYGRTVVFVPASRLVYGTIYTVSLADTVRVKGSDDKLLESVSFSFETTSANSGSYFNISESMLEFSSGDEVVIPVYSKNDNNSSNVAATVYAFPSVENFVDSLEELLQLPIWARASRAARVVDTSGLSKISTSDTVIQEIGYRKFVQLPDDLATGLYLVELQSGSITSQVLVQMTDLAVYSAVTSTDTIIWVNDVSTHGAVQNAQITSLDGRINTVTDAEGVAIIDGETVLADLDNPWNVNDYLTITSGDKFTVAQIGRSTNYYYINSPYQADEHWNYFYTDRSMYQPTDTVSFWGFVQNRDGSTPDNVRVTLSTQNYYYNQNEIPALYQETLPVIQGAYSGSTSFSRLTAGSYVLNVYQDDAVIDTRYIRVSEYDKPAYELGIDAIAVANFATESFTYSVDASFFEGTPVSNLALKADSTNAKVVSKAKTLQLDENGQGAIAFETTKQTCTFSTSCPLMNYGRVSVRPTFGEEAEIVASATQLVFNSRITADVAVERTDGQIINAALNAYNIDLDGINEDGKSYYAKDVYRGSAAGGVPVRGQVTETTYTRVNTGEVYDFINKVHRPTYRYESTHEIVNTFTGTTSPDGSFTYSYQGSEAKSYSIDFILGDDFGAEHIVSGSSYANTRFREWRDYDYYLINRIKEENSFNIGEVAEFAFEKNDEQIIADTDDSFLFLRLQNGLQDHEVSSDSLYSFVFNDDSAPNVTIDGVYFDGGSYTVPDFSFGSGATAELELSDRELSIAVSTDKDQYEPGEEVTISIKVTDANGLPTSAALNVNLVDEAFYALADEAVNPLEDLYQNVTSGLAFVGETHKFRSVAVLESSAEGGGCFLPGTKILLEDGSQKAIEDIVVGDRILTKQSERSEMLVGATVKQTFVHEVNEYMVINDKIRVTPVHRMFVNYGWQPIGSAKVGDALLAANGEVVRIDSIDWVREPVTVYNFEVEGLHTYFAEGIYVHNDKGGVRENLVDTALFESVTTSTNGTASITFELPDNITSWRITAQAISPDLEAGVGITPVISTKPIFADMIIASEYLESDKPQIKVRAYGEELSNDSQLAFKVTSESLDLNESFIESAYTARYLSLGSLAGQVGAHEVLVSVENDEYSDALQRTTSVVDSRISQLEVSEQMLSTETSLTDLAGADLRFSDAARGQYYNNLVQLHYASGGRSDQLAAHIESGKMLNEYFSDNFKVSDTELATYTTSNGLIALLPYASGDLELTVKIAAIDPELVDTYTLASTLYQTVDAQESTNQEIAQALFGLAAIGEPVLIPVKNLAELEDQAVGTRLYTALALAEIGDKENARRVYLDILRDYAEETDAYTRLKLPSATQTLEVTALASVLAGMIQDENTEKLWKYTSTVHEANVVTSLEKTLFLKTVLPNLPAADASFMLVVDGDEIDVDLTNGQVYRLRLTEDQASSAAIQEVNGLVALTISRSVRGDGTTQSDLVSLKREYFNTNGESVTEFNEGDLIEVRMTPSFTSSAPLGTYQITDIVPSGLTSVTQPRRYGNVLRPFAVSGQTVKFMYSNQGVYKSFSYYLRVASNGEFTAEPALIEYTDATTIRSFSEGTVIKITN